MASNDLREVTSHFVKAGNRAGEVTTETGEDHITYCEAHPKRTVAMHCVDCECAVCLACIAGDHAKHVFKEIPEIIKNKAEELIKILGMLQEETLPVLIDKLQNVRKVHSFYRDRHSECVSAVRAHGQMMKEHVNLVIDEYIDELEGQGKEETDSYNETETWLTERITNVNVILMRGRELSKYPNVGLVSFVTEAKRQLNICEDTGPTESRNLPDFDPFKLDQLILQKLFGHMLKGTILDSTDLEEHLKRNGDSKIGMGSTDHEAQTERERASKMDMNSTNQKDHFEHQRCSKNEMDSNDREENSQCQGSNRTDIDSTDWVTQSELDGANKDLTSSLDLGSDFLEQNECIRREIRHFSNRKLEMVTFPHQKRAVNICALSGKQAWVSGDGYLELLKCDGQIEKSVLVNFPIFGMTLTKKGELIFGTEGKIKKMTASGHFVDFAKTSPFDVYGMVSSGDKILACMYDGIHVGKLERLSHKGKVLQTIQYDRNKCALFGMPIYLTQMNSGDIWVSDRNNNCVVVLTAEGELKFRYRGSDSDKPFKPKYLSSDRDGHVLINDIGSHNVHLVDVEGNFVQFLLIHDHGFDGRWTLAQEKDNFIWMACAAHKTIIIFQKI